MSIRIHLITLLMTVALAVPAFAQTTLKIAVVDMETAMYEVDEGRRARTTLESKRDEYLGERDRRQAELNSKQEQLDAQAVMLAPEALQAAEEELYRLVTEGQMYVYETEQQIMALNQQLFGEILEKMERVCKAIAQEEGYDMVLDAAVVYSYTPDMDITSKVVSRYDATK
jgi:outer membrane protein